MGQKIIVISSQDDELIKKGGRRLGVKALLKGNTLIECALPVRGYPDFVKRTTKLHNAFHDDEPDARCKIYLQGHGHWVEKTLGGQTPLVWAEAISRSIPDPGKLIKVSILGCQAGRDVEAVHLYDVTAGKQRVHNSVDSFASEFHRCLRELGIRCRVDARLFDVMITKAGQKQTSDVLQNVEPTNEPRPFSKIFFTWEGDQQIRRWSDDSSHIEPDDSEWLQRLAAL